MNPPAEPPAAEPPAAEPPAAEPPRFLNRFTRAERVVHRVTAGLLLICLFTASALYMGPVSTLVGHRRLVELVHVYCGLALPVPLLGGLVSAAYRADLGRLNRFTRADRAWLRRRSARMDGALVGKFNAGQKLNGSLSAGAIIVLLGTGVLMHFTGLAPLSWRTGATFVHDWFALGFGLLVIGHIVKAAGDQQARLGMRTGRVPLGWARRHHRRWADAEVAARVSPQARIERPAGPN